MHGMVNIAVRAARQAGSIIVRHLNQLESLEVVEKGRNEFVSQVDRLAEEAIIEVIRDYHPDHSILAEESGGSGDHEDCGVCYTQCTKHFTRKVSVSGRVQDVYFCILPRGRQDRRGNTGLTALLFRLII